MGRFPILSIRRCFSLRLRWQTVDVEEEACQDFWFWWMTLQYCLTSTHARDKSFERDRPNPRAMISRFANVCYLYRANGAPKQMPWAHDVLKFIDDYRLENVVANPEHEDLTGPET